VRTWFRVLAAVAALAASAQPATSQSRTNDDGQPPPPRWTSDLAFLGGNALLGGLTAGVLRELRGGSFWPAFIGGAAGGGVAYAGRRIAVERFAGAGLLGREVASVGTSAVQNVAAGRGVLDQLVLPLALVRLQLARDSAGGSYRARFRLDVPTALVTAWYGLQGDVRFDLAASMSSGAPVFTTFGRWADGNWRGKQAAGAIWLQGNPDDPNPDADRADVLAHERVHVLQYDFGQLAWSDPMEGWLAARVTGGGRLDRYLDLGLHLLPWAAANAAVPYRLRPWEHEAHFLSTVRGH
jgi:hypothetical protein